MELEKIERPVLVVSAFVRKDDKILLTYDPKFEFWRVPGGRPNNEEKIENKLS